MSIWSDMFGRGKVDAQFFAYVGNGTPDRPEFYIDFDNDHAGSLKAFQDCGVLRTVVSRNAQAIANGKWWIVRGNGITDPDVSGSYPAISELLKRPNPKQEWSEFIIQCEIYRQIFGNLYIYASAPEGFDTGHSEHIWSIPPDRVIFNRNDTVSITLDDRIIIVKSDRICEIKDSGTFSTPTNKKSLRNNLNIHKSRVYSARFAIKNIIQAEEAIYSINHDRGALGLLSMEDKDASGRIPLQSKEREEILRQMQDRYGITGGKSKVILTNAAIKWQQMSMSVRDLMLLEGMDKNMETICNVFDYPKEMLISDAKYSNKQVAKGHYEDAVIPFSQIYASKLGSFFGLRPGDNFVVDFSHVPAMKDAEEQKAKTYYQKATAVVKLYEDGILSREEARLEMGYEQQIDGKNMFNQNDKSNGGTDSGANQGAQG